MAYDVEVADAKMSRDAPPIEMSNLTTLPTLTRAPAVSEMIGLLLMVLASVLAVVVVFLN